jgi:S1-C subfamily serine protease
MSAVSHRRPARVRRRRRRHGGALLAALAYGLAGFALYQLVAPSLDHDAEPRATPDVAVAAAPPAQAVLGAAGPRELLALRAVASRVQQSVYAVRARGAPGGSGFVAWVYQDKISFVLTARSAVAGGSGRLAVKHGHRSWTARIVHSDPATGLALLRVDAALDRPLWALTGDRAPLREGARALVVPAGKSGAFGQGTLSKAPHAFSLDAGDEPGYLGAPVLDDDGRLAGIVVGLSSGESRIVSLADACGPIRAC